MLGDVSAWADKRELLRDIDELIGSQKKLLQETASLTQQASSIDFIFETVPILHILSYIKYFYI